MNSDFKELLKIFADAKVEYLIIGGYAVAKHAEPRYTKDLDIWIDNSRENAERVYHALKEFGAPLTNITIEDFTIPTMVFSNRHRTVAHRYFDGFEGIRFQRMLGKTRDG
jgi:hypothetical protein